LAPNYNTKPRITLTDVCNIIKSLPGMSDFDCSLSGKSGEGFIGTSVVRVIQNSNYVLWVVVAKDGSIAYQVKTLKWLRNYYEFIEDSDEFFVVWNDKNRIIKYYLIEKTD